MNKNILSIVFLASLVMFFSCADEELGPILTFDKAGKGAYAKLLEETPGTRELDLNSSTAGYSYCVEFVDLDAGNTVSEYTINVTYVDNNPDNGMKGDGPVKIRTIGSGEFNSTARSFKGSCVEISMSELLATFSLSAEDLSANDQFLFETTVTNNEGGVFGQDNSDSDVNGSSFGGHFNYTLKATCPLPDDKFTGAYSLSYIGDASAGRGIPFPEGDIDVKASSSTLRTFNAPWLPGAADSIKLDVVFEVVCDFITFQDLNAKGCVTPIVIGPGEVTPLASLSDDAEIILNIIDYADDGGCDIEKAPKVIKLTKK